MSFVSVTLGSTDPDDKNKFIHFILLLENESGGMDTGNFQLRNHALTTFHIKCPNAVTQTNSIAKSEIQV